MKVSKIFGVIAFIAVIIMANVVFAQSDALIMEKPIDVHNTVNVPSLDDVDDKYSPELEDEIMRTIFGDDYQNLTMDTYTGSNTQSPISENVENMELIKGDKYIHVDNYELTQVVDGNILIVGTNVKIASPSISGNVCVVGDNITISGSIAGSVVAIGDNINVSGTMEDLYEAGDSITIESGANIERSLKTCGTKLNIQGGSIGYEIYAVEENLIIANEAGVPDKISYSGTIEAPEDVKERATIVEGAVEVQETSQAIEQVVSIVSKVLKTAYVVMTGLVALALIIIVSLLLKRSINREELLENPVRDIFQGLLYYIIIFAIIVVCCITIVLIPAAFTIIAVLFIVGKIVKVTGLVLVSHMILKDSSEKTGLVILLSAAIDLLVRLLIFTPVLWIGSIINIIFSCLGLRFYFHKIGSNKTPKKVKVDIVDASEVDKSVPKVEADPVSTETNNDEAGKEE